MMVESSQYWDAQHKTYEDSDWIKVPSIFARESVKYFPPNGTLLDLGAGQGQDSRFFVEQGYAVVSTDLSNYALSISKKKAEKSGLKYQIRQMDMSGGELPFNTAEYEVVFANLSLQYFDDEITKKLFDEIWRVLKVGGIFAALLNSNEDPGARDCKRISERLYLSDKGLMKRYYDLDYLQSLTRDKFRNIILDSEGSMLHDQKFQKLIRFIGKKEDTIEDEPE